MKIKNYSGLRISDRHRIRRRIIGIVIIVFIILAAAFIIGKLTENSAEYQLKVSLIEENRALREQAEELNNRIAELEGTVSEQDALISSLPTEEPEEEDEPTETEAADTSTFGGETPRNSRQ